MEALKTIWDFFKNEVLGMNWLNRLIETILNACGLDTTGKIGGSVQFFIYDIVMSQLHIINTYWALILPAMQSALGLYLMQNFMVQIPGELLEAARIDGAGELKIFWRVVMPNVKPAWLTTMIFVFQTIWNTSGQTQTTTIVYDEKIKMVSALMSQVVAGGTARAGAGAALAFLLMIPPVLLFLATQSRIIETMSTSGMK